MPKIGDKLYISSSYYISHGEDDVDGGLATIKSIKISDHLPADDNNSIFVTFEEIPGVEYNYKLLLEKQDKLSKEYADKIAKPNPDINTPWIEEGDIVNGEVYKGKPIW